MSGLASLGEPEILLTVLFFCTALWNTSVGPTGGINFASMAVILPPAAVIPIQAVVEAVFGSYRLWLLRQFLDWSFLRQFVIGGAVGFAIGVGLRFIGAPSDSLLQIIMGVLILAITWLPLAKAVADRQSFPWGVGMITSVIGLFVGGMAALIAAAAEKVDSDHRQVIATMSGGLLFHHVTKTVLFGTFGFSFISHAPLIVALLAAGLLDTLIGRRLLFDMPQHILKPTFKALVTFLACYLLWKGVAS